MRILTVGFNDEYVKELEKERHYELVIIVDEGVKFSLERYVNEVKKKKSETKIMILTENYRQQSG